MRQTLARGVRRMSAHRAQRAGRAPHCIWLAVFSWALSETAAAQGGEAAEAAPPSGPAEIIRRAGAARQARENNALPAGHPEVPAEQGQDPADPVQAPVGDDPHAHADG